MNAYKLNTTLKILLGTFLFIFFAIETVSADNPVWLESKDEAFSAAREQKKHVLMIWGNKRCSTCLIMKNYLNKPAIQEIVDKNFIPWYCDYDVCNDGGQYDQMFPSALIPLICIIDPDKPETPIAHSRGALNLEGFIQLLNTNNSTGNKNIGEKMVQTKINGDLLSVSNSLKNETIHIYTIDGQLVDSFEKKANNIIRRTDTLPKGMLLICSSENWSDKVMNN